MMFFKQTKRLAPKDAILLMNQQREDIKRRLADIEKVNIRLSEVARKTREISIDLADKVNRELKVAKKSLTSISAKLNEGLMMIDCCGKIIHINTFGTKLFHVSESYMTGKLLSDVISCANPSYDVDGNLVQKPILTDGFFRDLSVKIFEQFKHNADEKYIICNEALKAELPFCVESTDSTVLGVLAVCKEKTVALRVTLIVLDNDPESIEDISYICLFSEHK